MSKLFLVDPAQFTVEYPRAPRIIGFTGLARSGKDTAAEALSVFGHTRIGFADPLKEMVSTLMLSQGVDSNTVMAAVWGHDREKPQPSLGGRSARHALQTLGTEWGRDLIHPDLWLDACMNAIAAQPDRRFVISDVRFPNEAARIRDAGGMVIGVHRPGVEAMGHISEQHVIEVDRVLTNDAPSADAFARHVQDVYCAFISVAR